MSSSDVKSRLDVTGNQKNLAVVQDEWKSFFTNLADFLYWQRGEDIFVKTGSTTIAASILNTALPDLVAVAGEEWDVLAMWVIDTGAIDVMDAARFAIVSGDEISAGSIADKFLPLSKSLTGTAFTTGTQTYNFWQWPATLSDIGMATLLNQTPRVRKITATQRVLRVWFNTTATVGNRILTVWAYVRRRQI